ARLAIVFATCLQRRAIEGIDLMAILGRERQVQMRRLLLRLEQAQRSLALCAKLDTVRRRPLRDNRYAERFECLEEERLARCIVADSEFDVIKHELSCSSNLACRSTQSVRFDTDGTLAVARRNPASHTWSTLTAITGATARRTNRWCSSLAIRVASSR